VSQLASDEHIRLWSFHQANFSLPEGRVEHDRSEYYRGSSHIANAYHRLWEHLGTTQLVWCYTRREDFKITTGQKKEWAMRVPPSATIAFVDGFVWARIIRAGKFTPPRRLYFQWKDEARSHFPHDPNSREEFLSRKHQEFWDEPAPEGG
jgi:hypothetical protein